MNKHIAFLLISLLITLNDFAQTSINDSIIKTTINDSVKQSILTDSITNCITSDSIANDSITEKALIQSIQINDTLLHTKDTISIIGVGDIMLGTNYPSASYLPPDNNCTPLLAQVKSILQDADLTVGNLEGCFSDNAPLVKRCKDATKCYAFRMPVKYGKYLQNAVRSLQENQS